MDVAEVAPVVETPSAPVAPVETETLADHEAQFGPGAKQAHRPVSPGDETESSTTAATGETERDERGQFRKRAASQRAGAKDVDEIAELTKRLRQAETDAGLTQPERKPGESDRAYSLRRQAEVVEALRDAKRATAVPATAAPPRVEAPAAPPQAPPLPPFDTPKPKPEDFATADDPVTAYYEAIADWKFDKRLHEAQQQALARHSSEAQRAAIEHAKQHAASVDAKIQAFAKEHPDYWQRMESIDDLKLPDVLLETISTDDKPADLAYALAGKPDELVDLIGFAAALDYTPESVALLRRRLSRYVRDTNAKTGALPPAPVAVTVAPHPPTPVRTGPLKTGDEPPDDNDMSLANHEKHFGYKRR